MNVGWRILDLYSNLDWITHCGRPPDHATQERQYRCHPQDQYMSSAGSGGPSAQANTESSWSHANIWLCSVLCANMQAPNPIQVQRYLYGKAAHWRLHVALKKKEDTQFRHFFKPTYLLDLNNIRLQTKLLTFH